MSEVVFTIEQEPDGGFVAVADGVSIVTQGDSMTELEANINEAVATHFEGAGELPTIRIRNMDQ